MLFDFLDFCLFLDSFGVVLVDWFLLSVQLFSFLMETTSLCIVLVSITKEALTL